MNKDTKLFESSSIMAVNPGEVMKTGNAEGRNKTEQDRGHYQRNEREKYGKRFPLVLFPYMIQITTTYQNENKNSHFETILQ